MVQLILIGIVLYIVLYILAKLRIFPGVTKAFPVINTVLLTLLIIFVVIKSGLIRTIAMMLGAVIALAKDFIGSLF